MITIQKKHLSIYGRFTIFRAAKNGSPLPVETPKRIRDINGFMIQTKTRKIIVVFRRRLNF
jgi:hypothetical protein